jgi:hypothetical protein
MSNLLDAYKRGELDPATGLGIFALSATLTDRAEPSESLQGDDGLAGRADARSAPAFDRPTGGLSPRPARRPGV